jgi:hypothetical protein
LRKFCEGSQVAPPPNVLVVITDQQRAPRHWPDEAGWVDARSSG